MDWTAPKALKTNQQQKKAEEALPNFLSVTTTTYIQYNSTSWVSEGSVYTDFTSTLKAGEVVPSGPLVKQDVFLDCYIFYKPMFMNM